MVPALRPSEGCQLWAAAASPVLSTIHPSPELWQNRTETRAPGLQAGKSQQAVLLCEQDRGSREWTRHPLGGGHPANLSAFQHG